MLYCLGEDAEEILNMSGIEGADRTKYDKVIEKFDAHFAVRKNLIYIMKEPASSKKRESLSNYFSQLYIIWQKTEFGTLKNQMIRDRFVVGIQDATMSERLQMEPKLTLDKAMKLVHQRDTVKEQGTGV